MPAENRRPTTWVGGKIRYNAEGDSVFVLRKMVRGQLFIKTLEGVKRSEDALIEYARFRKDPDGYVSGTTDTAEQELFLDEILVRQYLTHCAARREDNGKENTRKWLNEKKAILLWWAARLVDDRGMQLDLRRVSRSKHVLPALNGVPGREEGSWITHPAKGSRHKREAIKALYGWLRKVEGRITAAEDPVMDMPVGRGRVAQTEGGKNKVIPREHAHMVAAYLIKKGSRFGHALIVQAATGWHTTELVRFIGYGEMVPVPRHLEEPGVTAIVIGPRHKNGRRHFAKIGERVAFSVKVLFDNDPGRDGLDLRSGFYRGVGEEVGSISYSWYNKAVREACVELKIPKFSPAWFRHTNATYALEQRGVNSSDVAKFLHHADSTMADTVYGPNAVPPKIPTIMDDEVTRKARRRARKPAEAPIRPRRLRAVD